MIMPLKTSSDIQEKVESRVEKREQVLHPVYPDPTLLFRMEKGAKYFGLVLNALSHMFNVFTFHFDEDAAWLAQVSFSLDGVHLALKLDTLSEYNPVDKLVHVPSWKMAEVLKFIRKGEPLEAYLHGNGIYMILKMARGTFNIALDEDDDRQKPIMREAINKMVVKSSFYSKGADWKLAIKSFKFLKMEFIDIICDGESVVLKAEEIIVLDKGEVELAITKEKLEPFKLRLSYDMLEKIIDFFPTDTFVRINDKGAMFLKLDAHSFEATMMITPFDDEDDFYLDDDGEDPNEGYEEFANI